MASSALATPAAYHKATPVIRKTKLDNTKVRGEDELLKFFLHGSYDVQRGNAYAASTEETDDKNSSMKDEIKINSSLDTDEKKLKSRCMFEETYMINISVKQPDKTPSSKQIDVRIEKTPTDAQTLDSKIDHDDISSIFDEDDNDEIDNVIFNDMNASTSETVPTKLTLADMINKTLTTIPTSLNDNVNKTNNVTPPTTTTTNNTWFVEQQTEKQKAPSNEDITQLKTHEKAVKRTSPTSNTNAATLTTNMSEDEKLFEYLDYLETKEESNHSVKPSIIPIATKSTTKPMSPIQKLPLKSTTQEPIPIIDLEQLCRSLTVTDLKDQYIRKKIHELKLLIDERHKTATGKCQIPVIKSRKDNLPVLIAMPPIAQQRRRTNPTQPVGSATLLQQSKTVNLQAQYNLTYSDINGNHNKKPLMPHSTNQQFTRCQIPITNMNCKYQYT